MAPLVEVFPASQLPDRVQVLPNGKRRKGEPIDLTKCELREFVQYACHLKGDRKSPQAVIQCEPVVKLFRRCVDALSLGQRAALIGCSRCAEGLMVETTALED